MSWFLVSWFASDQEGGLWRLVKPITQNLGNNETETLTALLKRDVCVNVIPQVLDSVLWDFPKINWNPENRTSFPLCQQFWYMAMFLEWLKDLIVCLSVLYRNLETRSSNPTSHSNARIYSPIFIIRGHQKNYNFPGCMCVCFPVSDSWLLNWAEICYLEVCCLVLALPT